MKANVVPMRAPSRTLATSRLEQAIEASGLTQERAGQLLGVDGRQVRRWLSGEVSLGPLELLCLLEEREAKAKEAA